MMEAQFEVAQADPQNPELAFNGGVVGVDRAFFYFGMCFVMASCLVLFPVFSPVVTDQNTRILQLECCWSPCHVLVRSSARLSL